MDMKLRKLTETQTRDMVRLREQGMSYHKIAQKFGVADNTVRCHTQPGWKEKHRDRFRKKYVDGVLANIKRPRPADGRCELCGRDCDKKKHRLNYHHWDPDDFGKGLWLCHGCHITANLLEGGVAERYERLKKNVEQSASSGSECVQV